MTTSTSEYLAMDNSPSAYVPCDAATQNCGFMVGPNSDYLAGHIIVFLVALFNASGAGLSYFLWKKPEFEETEANKWYAKAWKWFGWGLMITNGIPAIMWPFTFLFNNYYSFAYMYAWSFSGFWGALVVEFAVLGLLIKGLSRHDENETTSKKEMGTALGAFLGTQGLMAFLGFFFFWDTVLYMLPRTCKRRFDEKGNSSSSGVKYDF